MWEKLIIGDFEGFLERPLITRNVKLKIVGFQNIYPATYITYTVTDPVE
jgi:hypothetical protein